MIALLLGMLGGAWALDGNDRLELSLATGEVVRGWYYDLRDEPGGGATLVLTGGDRVQEVPVALVTGVRVDEEAVSLADFEAQLDAIRAERAAWAADPPPHPPAGVVVALSAVWPGAGHAALGDWATFGKYSAVELLLIGATGYALSQRSGASLLLPVIALDLTFRTTSAADAARLTRRRRARLGLRPAPLPALDEPASP